MKVKGIVQEDFINYKKPAMFISTATCSFKCDRESGTQCCQNGPLASQPDIEIGTGRLVAMYAGNQITRAVVFGGLEPMDQFEDLAKFISRLRATGCMDDVVIYTGYNKDEIPYKIWTLSAFPNVIVKYGRFVPNSEPRHDEVLGVTLASKNQYAERIS